MTAQAGGGPENVFVVVNSASWASQSVANHFIKLRDIPPVNVYLNSILQGGMPAWAGSAAARAFSIVAAIVPA